MAKNWPLTRRKETLRGRSTIIQEIRRFFIKEGYLEVDTPLRIPAPAPESHIDAIPSGRWFLHTSPELCMKRMLAAGYERIFQICRCWRDGERGMRHLPEFTMLEWYRIGADYRDLMSECEALIRSVAHVLGYGSCIRYQGMDIGISEPWERLSVSEAFSRYSAMTVAEALETDLFDEVMVRDIEPRLGFGKPTFIYDYPAERGALARIREDNPAVAERFELYIGGLELANAFSELTDAQEQRDRFVQESAFRESMNRTTYPLPEKFLDELSDMPPSAGIALGVDRLVMVLLDLSSIDDVVAFTPEEL